MNAELATLASRYWDAQVGHQPTVASLYGDHRWSDQFEDRSEATEQAFASELDSIASGASAISSEGLSGSVR